MAWRLTVRVGPRVQRSSYPTLEEALDALEARAQELSRDVRRDPLDVRYRRFEPAQQVAARLELSGPQRLVSSVHAGVDVHGDGSTTAYTGRVRRQELAAKGRRDAVATLRRELRQR